MMKKILLVFGTRPEAIKMAPLVNEFLKHKDIFNVKVCVTGQHREMLDQILHTFGIKPDYDLNIMEKHQDLFDVTTKVMLGMRSVLNDFLPDIIFVHGDTTTSMATSLSAFYKHIKIAHVEAGLRTYNLQSPWPEEVNRQITDKICDYYFTPTQQARQNLLNEQIDKNKIFVTGNTVVDALYFAISLIQKNDDIRTDTINTIKKSAYHISDRKYILVTGHRRENFGEGFVNICNALREIALQYPLFDIVYPVHLNPQVQKPVQELLGNVRNIFLIKPLDYLPFIYLMQHCHLILTDSGGIQEEAPALGKPVLLMRDTSERMEAVEAKTVKIVGTDSQCIIQNTIELLNNENLYNIMAQAHNPYGDGTASQKIVSLTISL